MLLLPALAHAALRDDLRTALANGPTAAVVCSSGTEAMQRVASSLELLGDEVGDTTPFTTLFNVNTAVGLTYWEANKTVEMRFAMADEAAARQWVSTVGERLGKDPRAYDVHWKDGWGAIQSGEIPTSNPAASTDLLAHLSDAPGCLLYMNVPTEKAGPVELALHLPFEKGAPAAWAIALEPLQGKKQPVPMVGATPLAVRTQTTPLSVVTVGFGLKEFDFAPFLHGVELRKARRAQRWFPVTGGSTFAVFQVNPTPVFAGVLPMARRLPARTIVRRAETALKGVDEAQVVRLDDELLQVTMDKATFYLSADRGALWVASDLPHLNDLRTGSGEPWVPPSVVPLAEQWPLVVATADLPAELGMPPLPRPAFLTVGVGDGVAYGLLDVPVSMDALMRLGEAARRSRGSALPKRPGE